MGFFGDLGKRLAGTDDYTKSVSELNLAQGDYLKGLATADVVDNEGRLADAKESNRFLIIATLGTLVVVGGASYFLLRKR